MSRRLRAVDSVSPFNHVQIEFQYPALAENPLHLFGDQCFVQLAKRILRGREKKVFCELLSDRRSPSLELTPVPIFLQRLPHLLPIETGVIEKARVFSRQHGSS